MDGTPFQRVAVLGPGLLGGSILLGIHSRSLGQGLVWGRRADPVEQLKRDGVVEVGVTDLAEVLASSPDLIILATPIGNMAELTTRIVENAVAPAVITDVGSTKEGVVESIENALAGSDRSLTFVGSHPMAGSEKAGLEHADADLFEGAACILTPIESTDPGALERVDAFWRSLGCRTSHLPPGLHDKVVAKISHLPHLVAAAVAKIGLDELVGAKDYLGPGFRDTTRIASGPPQMWAEILLENRESISESLRELIQSLESIHQFLNHIDRESVEEFLITAKELRDGIHQD